MNHILTKSQLLRPDLQSAALVLSSPIPHHPLLLPFSLLHNPLTFFLHDRGDENRRDRGGAPVNVAIAVSRLGGKTAFVGKLGDDIYFRNPSADMLLQPEEFNLDLIRSTPLHRVRHQRPDSVTSGQIPSPSA
ncbi:unnamed protein product [Linum perenne]